VLWVAFAIVHAGVGWLGFLMPNQPMGDVYRVYEPWSTQALSGGGIVGITEPWVYPQVALVPMVLAHAFAWIAGYTIGWAILVTLVDAVAFGVLVGRGHSHGRTTAAWFWLSFIALLGPVGLYRLEGVTAPLAIIACLWLVGRPWAASMLLAVATWIKVWPAALLAAAVIAVRRRGALLGGAALVTMFTLIVVVGAGGWANAFGFITEQTTRGLQVEAPFAMPYLWGAFLGIPGFSVYYSFELVTFQVTGTEIDVAIALSTPVMFLALAGVAVLGAVKAARGVGFAALFPPLSLALVLAFIAFNKVGSPQYLVWLVPSVVIGVVLNRYRWFLPATVVLAGALLTQLVYPLLYNGIIYPQLLPMLVLTARNLLLLALFVWMVVRVARLPVPATTRAKAAVPALP